MSKLIEGIKHIRDLKVDRAQMQVLYVNLLFELDMLYHFDDDADQILFDHM